MKKIDQNHIIILYEKKGKWFYSPAIWESPKEISTGLTYQDAIKDATFYAWYLNSVNKKNYTHYQDCNGNLVEFDFSGYDFSSFVAN